MTPSPGFIHRLISITYPRGSWNKWIVMLKAFIDESGIHDAAPFCIVAGYLGSARQWEKFEELWCKNPVFPAKSYFARDPQGRRVPPYKGWDDAKAQLYFRDLVRAITSVNIYPVGGVVNVEDSFEYPEQERSHLTGSDGLIRKQTITGAPTKPYFLAFQEAIAGSIMMLKDKRLRIYFTFDQQKQFAPLALELYKHFKKDDEPYALQMGDAIYSSRSEALGLQAADLLCYCWYQRIVKNSRDRNILRFIQCQKIKRLTLFNKESMDKILGKIPSDIRSKPLILG